MFRGIPIRIRSVKKYFTKLNKKERKIFVENFLKLRAFHEAGKFIIHKKMPSRKVKKAINNISNKFHPKNFFFPLDLAHQKVLSKQKSLRLIIFRSAQVTKLVGNL